MKNKAVVIDRFFSIKTGLLCGCRCTSGEINVNKEVDVIRNRKKIGTYSIKNMKQFKEDIEVAKKKDEFAIAFDAHHDIETGDIFIQQ